MLIGFFGFEILLAVGGLYLIWSWLNQTPFYPSSAKKLKELIDSKEIILPKPTNFIDIGSGDGRIVKMMADYCEKSEGIEFNPYLSLLSRLRLLTTKKNNTEIHNKDFFKHDFSRYNVAYLYIFNEQIDKLKDKLFSEMPKNSIIITNTFKFSDKEPDKTIGRYYLYKLK